MDESLEKFKDPQWWINKCCTDLYFLNRVILMTLEDPTPGYKDLYAPTHKRICDFVQKWAKEGQKVLILTPRGWIKSYLITVGWSIQRLLQNFILSRREHQIISNATIANSEEFLDKIKHNLQYNSLLTGLFKEFLPDDPETKCEKWTQKEIRIKGCRIETGSVEGNLVSRHYKIIINDDLVNLDNSTTRERIAKTIEWWQLAQSLLLTDGIEIIIGTRWDFDDLYGHIIEKFIQPPRDWTEGKPITEHHNGRYHVLQMDCWEDVKEETGSTFPILFPEERLKEIEEEQAERFGGQYRNDPLAKGTNPFKQVWFTHRFRDHAVPPQRHTVFLIDPSGVAKTGSSYTGSVMIDLCPGKKGYIRFGERKMITDLALAEYIIEKSMQYHPDTIGIEYNKYHVIYDMLEILIEKKFRKGEIPHEEREYVKTLPYILVELRPQGRPKEVRIGHLASWFENGDFLIPYSGAEQLVDELIRFPRSAKRDIADALAYILDNLIFPEKTDPPKALVVPEYLKKTQEEMIKDEWDNIEEEVFREQQEKFDDFDLD